MNLRSLQYRTSWIRVYSSCCFFFGSVEVFIIMIFLSFFSFCWLFHRCPSIWPRMRMIFMPYLYWYEMRSCGFRTVELPLFITLLITFLSQRLQMPVCVYWLGSSNMRDRNERRRWREKKHTMKNTNKWNIHDNIENKENWQSAPHFHSHSHSYLHISATWVCLAYYYTFNTRKSTEEKWMRTKQRKSIARIQYSRCRRKVSGKKSTKEKQIM